MTFDRLPKGATVAVTGATGLVGSAIVVLLLQKGFRVRGVGRSATRAAPFTSHLKGQFGEQSFEFVEVADYNSVDILKDTFKDTEGIIHVAHEMNPANTPADADEALAMAAAATLGVLKAAAVLPSVKAVVLTSSSSVAHKEQNGDGERYSLEIYKDYMIPMARNVPLTEPSRPFVIYMAMKVHAELEAWKYWRETKPAYALNTVLPFYVAGTVFNPTPGAYLTYHKLNDIFVGAETDAPFWVNSTEFISDTRDSAAIHVAALLSSETNGERLFAAEQSFNGNKALAVWRKAFPERKFRPDFEMPYAEVTLDASRSTKLLNELEGRGWYTLEETVLANVASVV